MSQDRTLLFSVHANGYGKIHLYLEERDAVLDLVEEAAREATPEYATELVRLGRVSNLKTQAGGDEYESYRNEMREIALLICGMTEDEALDLAQDLVRAVAYRRSPRLEIVK